MAGFSGKRLQEDVSMILIAPYAQKLRNGNPNPKNPPKEFWVELLGMIDEPIIQIGVTGEEPLVSDFRKDLPVGALRSLIQACRTWISVDSFFQHLAWDESKPGIVLWGQSDPAIFGHPQNHNLLKSRTFLRPNQFLWWEDCEYKKEAFVDPKDVVQFIR